MKTLGKTGFIGRFKPLHLGAAVALESLCEQSDHVVIGIGSSNKYNSRNPFTPDETREMIDLVFAPRHSNYSIVYVPDSAHIPEYKDGQKWKKDVKEQFGDLDYFVSGNKYVTELLADQYEIIHPVSIIPSDRKIMIKGTQVRIEMARDGDWQSLVPNPIAEYLERTGLIERFKKEFGLETLAQLADAYWMPESSDQERKHTYEG